MKSQLFAYADETVFERRQGDCVTRSLGCGVFITKKEIPETLILGALDELKTLDIDKGGLFTKTLNRSFFHATDDTIGAKSVFIKHINENVEGLFCVAYYNDIKSLQAEQKNWGSFFDHCLEAASTEFFNTMAEVNLIIEKRDGLNSKHIERWKDQMYTDFENSTIKLPSMKTFFPRFNIRMGDKMVPGLQVTDLFLWVVNRSMHDPADKLLMNKLMISFHYYSTTDNKRFQEGGQFYLNGYSVTPPNNYPFKVAETRTNQEVYQAYVLIEKVLRRLEPSDFDEQSIHLYDDVRKLASSLKKTDYFLNVWDLQDMGRVFLRIFDSLPVYEYVNVKSEEDWRLIFHCKHIASVMIIVGQLHGVRTRNAIARFRHEHQRLGTLEGIMNA